MIHKENTQRGHILLSTLICSAVLGILSAWSFDLILDDAELLATHYHSLIAGEKAKDLALQKVFSVARSEASITCVQEKASHGKVSRLQRLCLIPLASRRHRIDSNAFLTNLTKCRGSFLASPEVSLGSFRLTPFSLVSKLSCTPPLRISRNISFAANIDSTEPLAISAAPKPGVIRVLGYADISMIAAENSFQIFAGGDIRILNLESTKALDVELISGSGTVVLEKCSPLIKVKAIAPRGVYLPPEMQNQAQRSDKFEANYIAWAA